MIEPSFPSPYNPDAALSITANPLPRTIPGGWLYPQSLKPILSRYAMKSSLIDLCHWAIQEPGHWVKHLPRHEQQDALAPIRNCFMRLQKRHVWFEIIRPLTPVGEEPIETFVHLLLFPQGNPWLSRRNRAYRGRKPKDWSELLEIIQHTEPVYLIEDELPELYLIPTLPTIRGYGMGDLACLLDDGDY